MLLPDNTTLQADIHVQEALYCMDEDVRSDALALVCSTLKKSGRCLFILGVSLS